MIRYPRPLQAGAKIGVTAPSSGVLPGYHPRLDIAIRHLESQGFQVIEGTCLRSDHKHVSGPKEQRLADFLRFWNDPDVAMIFPPWGGELAHELLPLLDFAALKQNPTWVQGFSDTSTLLLPITLKTDIATSHGCNLIDSVPSQTDDLTRQALDILRLAAGDSLRQTASLLWQKQWPNYQTTPDASYQLVEPTVWKILDKTEQTSFHGRLIGGCLDTLASLVGTRFGDVPAFIRRHQEDGIILYLENCEQTPTSVHRMLFHMKMADWFKGIQGILIGRSSGPDPAASERLRYAEALEDILGDLDLPIIYDFDTGHVVPQMTLVNGAMATVYCQNGRGWLEQKFI